MMKGYILDLKQVFKAEWGYDLDLLNENDPVFGKVEGGLWTVMVNFFGEQQANGRVRKQHNVLSVEDLKKLYCSPELSGTTPRSFQCRLIFGVALLTAMRPCELAFLKMSQFRKQRLNGSDTWVIKGIIGDSNGT